MRGFLLGFLGLVACSSAAVTPDTASDPTAPPPPTSSTPTSPTMPSSPVMPATTTCTGKTGASGDRTIDVQGHKVDVHVPAGYDPSKSMPLVLAFHGYLMASAEMRSTTHLDDAADKNGFIVGFPNGKNESWNGGDCCGDASSQKEDDVAVAKAIVASIDADYCIDSKRTFATGFSNGGFLAYRLACEAADVFAAVAPVSAVLGIDPKDCKTVAPRARAGSAWHQRHRRSLQRRTIRVPRARVSLGRHDDEGVGRERRVRNDQDDGLLAGRREVRIVEAVWCEHGRRAVHDRRRRARVARRVGLQRVLERVESHGHGDELPARASDAVTVTDTRADPSAAVPYR